jgi:hypothetical protein
MGRRLGVVLAVWLVMVGLDFVLNAALLAGMYQHGGTFLLTPAELFQRIPLGYASFLVLAVGITELALRLGATRMSEGIRLGFVSGVVLGAAWALGLYSVAAVTPQVAGALAGIWWALLTVAGGVAATGLGRRSTHWGLIVRVLGIDVLCVAAVIALQSLGIVPTLKP